jgi:hypothetical protein
MISSLRSDTDDAPPSEEYLPGAQRAQFKACRDAAEGSPSTPASSAVHGDRPPEEHNTSLLGITQLLERLTTQVDNSRIAQAESSADWERRFATFVQDTQDPQHVTERSRSNSQSRTGGNDVQQAIQEEALRSDAFRTNSSSSDMPIGHRSTNDHRHGSTPIFSNATPFSTSRTTRRQSILTALSPGPSRMTGGSSPYPDDDPPPPGNFRGYAPPTRAAFTGPSLHLKSDCPHICWQLSHDKGPYGGNHDRFMKFVYNFPAMRQHNSCFFSIFSGPSFRPQVFTMDLSLTLASFILWSISQNPRLMRRTCPIATVQNGRIDHTRPMLTANSVSRCTVF